MRPETFVEMLDRLQKEAEQEIRHAANQAIEDLKLAFAAAIERLHNPQLQVAELEPIQELPEPEPRNPEAPEGMATAMAPSQVAIEAARSKLGTPYKYGGGNENGPTVGVIRDEAIPGFDCSGLVQYSYAQADVSLPRTTFDQFKIGTEVKWEDRMPGDLVFSSFEKEGPGHVSILLTVAGAKADLVIEAGDPVEISQYDLNSRGKTVLRRVV